MSSVYAMELEYNGFFSMYVSDQTFYFIILGIITAYLSNVFLKDKINLSNIKSIHKIKKIK